MIATVEPSAERRNDPLSVGSYLKRDGKAMILAGLVTVCLELGVYFGARIAGAGEPDAVLGALAIGVLWMTLAAGPLAASGADFLASLLRAGIVADASALCLVVLWLVSPLVSILACLQVYCVLAAMAIFAVVLVRVARSQAGKCAMGLAAGLIMATAVSTPFWTGGLLAAGNHQTAQTLVDWAVSVNPFYSVCVSLSERVGFVWHQAPLLYRITRIGDYASPVPPNWYDCPLIFTAGAIVAGLVGILIRKTRSPATSRGTPGRV